LAGFALGAKTTLLFLAVGDYGWTGGASSVVVALCPLLIGFVLVAATARQLPALAVFLLAAVVACPWIWLHWRAPWQTYLAMLPRRECWGMVRCQLQEGGFDSRQLSLLSAGHPRMVGMVTEVQTMASPGQWRRACGKLLLRGNKITSDELSHLLAGEKLEAEGQFLLPPHGEELYGFYGDYLKSLGIRQIFLVNSLHPKGRGTDLKCRWRRALARLRQRLAELLVSDMPDKSAAGMYLALGLGLREYLPGSAQEVFLKSGTIHLFAISGLHVAVVSAICLQLLVLIGVPWRLRLLLSGGLCLGYALLTGMSPSSWRATLMVLLWIYAQLRWRPGNSLHILSLTGNLALLSNPLLVLNTGFLYSYLAVVILLVIWTAGNSFSTVLFEKKHWVPRRLQGWQPLRKALERLGLHDVWANWLLWREKLPTALLSSCLVWLGTACLTASRGRWLCLTSPLLNLPLTAMIPLVLGSCPLKILCALCWPQANRWLAGKVACLLQILQALAETAAEAPGSFPVRAPGAMETVLFYSALAALLLSLNKNRR